MPLDTVYWQKGLLTKEPRTTPLGHGVDPVLDRHGAYRILASRSFSSSLTASRSQEQTSIGDLERCRMQTLGVGAGAHSIPPLRRAAPPRRSSA
jgi:hypothetical protein